ncbi:MAG TPA: F0F1 ATP synthase subunit B [Gemmatimonadales bacterium]
MTAVFSSLLAVQEQAAAEPAGPFVINGGLIIWTLVIFGLLLFVLAKFAWPVILKQVEEREHRIRQQLEDAAKANADAQKLLADYQSQVAGAQSQAQEMVAQGRQAGEKLREEIVAKGRAEQEELLERARREIALERDRAVAELRKEAVDLSIAAATKVIEKNLDTEADRKLVTDYLASLRNTAS